MRKKLYVLKLILDLTNGIPKQEFGLCLALKAHSHV